MGINWTCPYCNRPQTVVAEKRHIETVSAGINDLMEGPMVIQVTTYGCANPDCKRLTAHIRVGEWQTNSGYAALNINKPLLFSERILPRGDCKPQPECIPPAIREDYYEACLIRDLSPKASATLARRCLQGMIRDFCGITRGRLLDEIRALDDAVETGTADRSITPESVQAIDHIRSIGNIGAHMEKDINLIVPVDPHEAQALIELLELLFEEWYVARETRRRKLETIGLIAAEKAAIRKGLPPAQDAIALIEAPKAD